MDQLKIGRFIFFGVVFLTLRIETYVGYYECDNCHHRYISTYGSVSFAIHYGQTRYMKCPKCHKYSRNNKIII
ncbi:MAG: hypothetical protein J6S49_04745 [Erysipelotrichaceae bacterium]|nr:hypothetical protein [Erysipelotrichaceae bacterium]